MDVKAPAEPITPSIATPTAERRCAEVGVGNVVESPESVELEETISFGTDGDLNEKKDVGRAIRTTPIKETREAYRAERGKGSRRKT
jgi:hypothetical protein